MFKNILNCTPHEINIIVGSELDPTIRKHKGGKQICAFPPSGNILSVEFDRQYIGTENFPLWRTEIISVDPLPEGDYNEYIVSALYASAYRKIHGDDGVVLLSPGDLVVAEDGRTPLGCAGFVLN